MDPVKQFFNAQHQALAGNEAQALDHAWYKPLLRFASSRLDVICKMIGDGPVTNVVDLACGACALAARKLPQFGHYTGLEISSGELARVPAHVRSSPKVTLRECDLNQPLDLPGAAFDLAVSASTIEYLFDPPAFVREIARILAPGGTLLLHTLNLAFLPRRLQLLFGKLPTFNRAPGWQGGVLHEFTYATLGSLLRSSGFEVLERRCSGVAPGLRMGWPSLLAGDMIFRARKIVT